MVTIALIGPDGAGKTTVSSRLEAELSLQVKSIYMGVNLHSSDVMLPHTRLLLALRRRTRGSEPSTLSDIEKYKPPPKPAAGRSAAALRSGLRLANWLAEESYRQAVASYYRRRGIIVVYDRHFFADFYSEQLRPDMSRRSLSRSVHAFFLRSVYPKPDLVIFLDAPAEVLYARKPEGSLNRLREKRDEYLHLCSLQPDWVVVDAGMPIEKVTREVAAMIRSLYEKKRGAVPRANRRRA